MDASEIKDASSAVDYMLSRAKWVEPQIRQVISQASGPGKYRWAAGQVMAMVGAANNLAVACEEFGVGPQARELADRCVLVSKAILQELESEGGLD